MIQVKAERVRMADTDPMINPSPNLGLHSVLDAAGDRIAPVAAPRFRDLPQIVEMLQRLSWDAAVLLQRPGAEEDRRLLRQLSAWLDGRLQAFATAFEALRREPGTGPLIDDWLAHAPPPEQGFDGGNASLAALLSSIACMESHLILLFGTLMQHSDGPWVRALYQDLLDHRSPAAEQRPCRSRS